MTQSTAPLSVDVVVVGAGFGGLATVLRLSELGLRVSLHERIGYPGGCASTFRRGGHRFEAGATLFSGFGPGQLFARWIAEHDLDVTIDWLDPVVRFRAPDLQIDVPNRRAALEERFASLPGAPAERLAAFFAEQARVADALWGLLDDPALLPPLGVSGVLRHVLRAPHLAAVARRAGRSLHDVVRAHGLEDFTPFVTFLDAVARITVQCGVHEAEAPLALSTLDYFFRGTGHVRGGIGVLARGLADAITRRGGVVRMTDGVERVETSADGVVVTTRRGVVRARHAVLNVLPAVARRLTGTRPGASRRLDALERAVARSWGACMLYAVVRDPPGGDAAPFHVQIVQDASAPLLEGNLLFASFGEPTPAGTRSVTVSTHVRMEPLLATGAAGRATRVRAVQDRMREGLATFLPAWWHGRIVEAPASPRTFERFTGRTHGYVGGVPRRVGFANYRDLVPRPVVPRVSLVGDSVFPGQSTLATALGGYKLAEVLARDIDAGA